MARNKTNHKLDREGEDLLLVIRAAALALSRSQPTTQHETYDAALVLWKTQVEALFRYQYPHRDFDDKVFQNAIADALHYAKNFRENHSKC